MVRSVNGGNELLLFHSREQPTDLLWGMDWSGTRDGWWLIDSKSQLLYEHVRCTVIIYRVKIMPCVGYYRMYNISSIINIIQQ